MKKLNIWKLSGYIAFLLAGFALSFAANAAQPVPSVFSSTGKVLRTYSTIPVGSFVAIADVGNDGTSEIITGSPSGEKPTVKILRLDGSIIRTINLGNVTGKPGVHVAAGNVDSDSEKEIIVSFGKGTAPEVRIYSSLGVREQAFLVFGKGFRGGVNISAGDVDADGIADVIAGAGEGGGPFVTAFTGAGSKILQFHAYGKSTRAGVQVHAGDVNGDGLLEIVTTSRTKNAPVKVFSTTGIVSTAFSIKKVQPASVNISSLGQGEILLGSASGSTAQVVSYDMHGEAGEIQFYPYGKKFTGDLSAVSVDIDADGAQEIFVVPNPATTISGEKRIVIDISDQRMYRYVGTALVATHVVSTGKWSMPTPLGSHQIYNKLGTAYSRKYALYMDNWMAITADGAYGIHSLPYWRLKNGGVYYEGVSHLGRRVSHGCIRLSPAESKTVFAWTTVGTKVQVVD